MGRRKAGADGDEGPTGIEKIQELLRLMEAHGLAELEVESPDMKVRLKKAHGGVEGAAPAVAQPTTAQAAGEAEAAGIDEEGRRVISPIVGTFYRAASPDAEPFCEVGDPVEPDTVVCIVEAMKVMNEVKAEVSGTIKKALVENGKPVEYGQPLFLVSQ